MAWKEVLVMEERCSFVLLAEKRQQSYEPNRDLITEFHNQAQGETISKFEYQNDALGRRTQRLDTTANVTITNNFEHNFRNELTNALMGTESFVWAFDPIGNRLTSSMNSTSLAYSVNSLNQYTNIANGITNSLAHDLDGNLLAHNGWTLTWDGENRLIQASNATEVVTFIYDYMGRRVSKVVGSVSTNHFVYDGWNLISETINSSTNSPSTNVYTWGLDLSQSLQGAGGVGGLLSQTTINSSTANCSFAAYDANGNITEYVDTNGITVAHYDYDAFGGKISQSGSKPDDFHFQFSTKYLDSKTGYYYYGFRHYIPAQGRWLSRDPLSEPESRQGPNLYQFVNNEPINNWDYLGLWKCCDGGTVGKWKRGGCGGLSSCIGDCFNSGQTPWTQAAGGSISSLLPENPATGGPIELDGGYPDDENTDQSDIAGCLAECLTTRECCSGE